MQFCRFFPSFVSRWSARTLVQLKMHFSWVTTQMALSVPAVLHLTVSLLSQLLIPIPRLTSVAGLAVFALMGGRKERRLDMLPGALLAATLGLLLARPLGPLLQARVTTLADVGDLTIKDIRREDRRNLVVHFVETA